MEVRLWLSAELSRSVFGCDDGDDEDPTADGGGDDRDTDSDSDGDGIVDAQDLDCQ